MSATYSYEMIKAHNGFFIAERDRHQELVPMHRTPIVSEEAAQRLRRDLCMGTCPFELTTPTSAFDPGEHMAACYELAARLVPLIGDFPDAWPIALRIADARPWNDDLIFHGAIGEGGESDDLHAVF